MPDWDKIIAGDCASVLPSFGEEYIDLVVTSPPYDSLRDYQGFEFDFPNIVSELYKAMKPGGVVVWVVNDSVKDGSETGTSFRQALHFMKKGFNLHDTMLYAKSNPTPNGGMHQRRFQQAFEYMFVFSKGQPKTFNLIARPRRNKWNDGRTFRKNKFFNRVKNGDFKPNPGYYEMSKEYSLLENIWWYVVGGGNSSEERNIDHPAIFPEQLALEHIWAWSNKGDLVVDPMCGSGTTLRMAKLAGRQYLGIDISEEYCKLSEHRVASAEFNSVEPTMVKLFSGDDAILVEPGGNTGKK